MKRSAAVAKVDTVIMTTSTFIILFYVLIYIFTTTIYSVPGVGGSKAFWTKLKNTARLDS